MYHWEKNLHLVSDQPLSLSLSQSQSSSMFIVPLPC